MDVMVEVVALSLRIIPRTSPSPNHRLRGKQKIVCAAIDVCYISVQGRRRRVEVIAHGLNKRRSRRSRTSLRSRPGTRRVDLFILIHVGMLQAKLAQLHKEPNVKEHEN